MRSTAFTPVIQHRTNPKTQTMHHLISGRGQPFIFQHGLSSNLQQPQQILAGLEDIQLISMDCPGHGQAPLPAGKQPSFAYYTDEVIRLMDHLEIEETIIGGISMGSGISLQLALRAPERIKALVLVRPAWLDQPNPETLRILSKAAGFIGKKDGQEAFRQEPDFQKIARPLPKAGDSILGVFAETQRPEIPTVLKSMVEDRPLKELKELEQIQQAVLIIANGDDPLHPFEMAESIHHHLPNSRLERVTSRYINNEQHTQEVNQLVSKFIKTI